MGAQNILIQGVGGIGGVMAATIIASGMNPVLITGNPEITAAIAGRGINTTMPGKRKPIVVPARVYTAIEELTQDMKFDAAYLIMKATSVVEAAQKTIPHLEGDGYVVTFQNGIVEDAVAAAVGADRVVSGIIGWGGTMHAPGVYEKTSPGETHIGELDGEMTARLRDLADDIASSAPVVISGNIRGALWSKLAINCTITTLGAITGETLGQMLADRQTRLVLMRIYTEVIDTAEANGIKLERITADPRLLYLPKRAGFITRWKKDFIARMVGRKFAKVKSSMLQGLERGRKTEIDFLNGYVVEYAKKAGVPVPMNECLVGQIKEIETGARGMSPLNLRDLKQAM